LNTTYTIKPGNHYSRWLPSITFRDFIDFRATLTESCRYDLPVTDYEHDYDINKLAGISTTLNHHWQSARLGWRCIDGQTFQLLPYTYAHGARVTTDTVLATVGPGEEFRCRIEDWETHYRYHLWTPAQGYVTHEVPKAPDRLWFNLHLRLHPFFGGTVPSPHRMTILLTWL
jgi:hypothetical protein